MGSACELECETILSFDLAFITEAMQEQILEKLIQIKRMLGSLANTLLSSLEQAAPPSPFEQGSGKCSGASDGDTS